MSVNEQIDILARTIFGEARGENIETKLLVAWVIRNRVEKGGWYGNTYKEVCQKPYQFSCWNKSDPNYKKILEAELVDATSYKVCYGVAQAVYYARDKDNPIPGILHYFDISIDPPDWAKSGEEIKIADVPKLRFYKNVS